MDDVSMLARLVSDGVSADALAIAERIVGLRRDSDRLRRSNAELERENQRLSERIAEEEARVDV